MIKSKTECILFEILKDRYKTNDGINVIKKDQNGIISVKEFTTNIGYCKQYNSGSLQWPEYHSVQCRFSELFFLNTLYIFINQ